MEQAELAHRQESTRTAPREQASAEARRHHLDPGVAGRHRKPVLWKLRAQLPAIPRRDDY